MNRSAVIWLLFCDPPPSSSSYLEESTDIHYFYWMSSLVLRSLYSSVDVTNNFSVGRRSCRQHTFINKNVAEGQREISPSFTGREHKKAKGQFGTGEDAGRAAGPQTQQSRQLSGTEAANMDDGCRRIRATPASSLFLPDSV